jgi:DNA-binding transcriptional LysR family regulator
LIDKLELLLALAKERHFGRAAEACGVTQPTMSTSLKQLEEILGVMLVQRGSRFQGFTPEGERTLDWARRIVGDARAMRQEINSLKDTLSGEIRIAAIPTVLGMVASLTTPFRARYPDVRFQIRSCTSADVLGLLENLEVDAGLTYIENEPIGRGRTIPLYNESYRLLTAPDAMFGDRRPGASRPRSSTDAGIAYAAFAFCGSRGSVIRTTVPLPSFERSRIWPPCRLVSERAIASPSPEP